MADAGPIIATAIENNVHAVEVNTRAVEQFSYTARKLIKWMMLLTISNVMLFLYDKFPQLYSFAFYSDVSNFYKELLSPVIGGALS